MYSFFRVANKYVDLETFAFTFFFLHSLFSFCIYFFLCMSSWQYVLLFCFLIVLVFSENKILLVEEIFLKFSSLINFNTVTTRFVCNFFKFDHHVTKMKWNQVFEIKTGHWFKVIEFASFETKMNFLHEKLKKLLQFKHDLNLNQNQKIFKKLYISSATLLLLMTNSRNWWYSERIKNSATFETKTNFLQWKLTEL